MKTFYICLSVLASISPWHANAAIYKCTAADRSVVYQDTPCNLSTKSEIVAAANIPDGQAITYSDAAISAAPTLGLTLGMSDTQVLNLRGWGRPGKITRAKTKRAWLEEW